MWNDEQRLRTAAAAFARALTAPPEQGFDFDAPIDAADVKGNLRDFLGALREQIDRAMRW